MKHSAFSFITCLVLLLIVRVAVMAFTPVFEPSEARYAAIAANMARTGDFLVPSFTCRGVYRSFDGKPPLVFQAGGCLARVFGISELAVRAFPFLSAILLGVILHRVVRRLKNPAAARATVALYATSTAIYAAAGFCMTDVPLACCVSGAVMSYAAYRKDDRMPDLLVTALLLGCGMLVKGPVALVLFALPVAWDALFIRRSVSFRWRRAAAAVALFLSITVPWYALMQHCNPGFLHYFFINENLLRFLVHEYGDKYGAGREFFRGMALVWLLVSTLPWSLRYGLAVLRHSPRTWWRRCRKVRWTLPSLGVAGITAFWCCTSRVPLAYLFPAVPLFAAACAVGRHGRVWARVVDRTFPAAAALALIVLCGSLACAWRLTDKMPGRSASPRVDARHFSYEFYHGPWGAGHPDWREPR